MIRIELTAGPATRLAFAYSPVNEAIFSLHVLVQPSHHPLQHDWVRRARAFPPNLRRRITEFSFMYEDYMPSLLTPSEQSLFSTFEQELESLRALEPERVAYELTRPFDLEFPRNPETFDDPATRRAIVERASAHGPDAGRLVRALLDDPATVLAEVQQLFADYWDAAFAEEWERIEPKLAHAVSSAGRVLVDGDLFSFLSSVSPRVRGDREASSLWIDKAVDADVKLPVTTPLVLVPSVYLWPHIGVDLDASLSPTVVYPSPYMAEQSRPRIPPKELVRVLRAVADDTRLRALHFIAERPRSTQELALLVGVSESALSKHLRLLAQAEILTTRRDGYYVLYDLVAGRIEALSASVAAYLEEP